MRHWLLDTVFWLAIIAFWIFAKKNQYWLIGAFIKNKTGYVERKEKIKTSFLESKVRAYVQDVKRRSPDDLNWIEKIFAPILNLKKYTGTTANLISFLRILLAIIVFLLIIIYWLTGERAIILLTALFCYTISGLSDFLDGVIARILEEISRLGKIIDPIADKILFAVPLFTFGLIYSSDFTFWMVVRQEAFLLIISVLKWTIHKLPFSMVEHANYWGKTKTVFELVAGGFLILCPLNPIFISVSNFLLLCSLPLAIGSIVGYLSSVKRLKIERLAA